MLSEFSCAFCLRSRPCLSVRVGGVVFLFLFCVVTSSTYSGWWADAVVFCSLAADLSNPSPFAGVASWLDLTAIC